MGGRTTRVCNMEGPPPPPGPLAVAEGLPSPEKPYPWGRGLPLNQVKEKSNPQLITGAALERRRLAGMPTDDINAAFAELHLAACVRAKAYQDYLKQKDVTARKELLGLEVLPPTATLDHLEQIAIPTASMIGSERTPYVQWTETPPGVRPYRVFCLIYTRTRLLLTRVIDTVRFFATNVETLAAAVQHWRETHGDASVASPFIVNDELCRVLAFKPGTRFIETTWVVRLHAHLHPQNPTPPALLPPPALAVREVVETGTQTETAVAVADGHDDVVDVDALPAPRKRPLPDHAPAREPKRPVPVPSPSPVPAPRPARQRVAPKRM